MEIGIHDYIRDGTRNAKFCRDRFRGSAPQICNFAVPLENRPNYFFFVFFWRGGLFNKASAYTPRRIFMQNTSKDLVPGKEVFLGIQMIICNSWPFNHRNTVHGVLVVTLAMLLRLTDCRFISLLFIISETVLTGLVFFSRKSI